MSKTKKSTGMRQYRHGDVWLQEVNSLPREAKIKDSSTVAEGELTGHSHRLMGDFGMYERNGEIFFSVGDKGASIIHQEHAKIDLPAKSTFKATIQREWSPDGERRVMD